MAESIGEMAVNITARVDKFGADLRVAANQVRRFQSNVDRGSAKGGFLGNIVPTIDLVSGFRLVASAAQQAANAVKEIAARVDEAADKADQLGTTFNNLAGLNFAADIAGSSSEAVGAGLAIMLRNLNQMGEESKRAGQAIAFLKLKVDDLRGKDTVAAFTDIADAISKLDARSDRVAATVAIFGKQAIGLLPILEQGAAGINRLSNEAAILGARLNDDALSALRDTNDEFTRMKTAASGAANRLASASGVSKGMSHITNTLSALNALWDGYTARAKTAATATSQVATKTTKIGEALESSLANFERIEDLQKRAAGIFGATRTPQERFEQTRKELLELRETIDQLTGKPLINAQTFSRAMKAAREELQKSEQGRLKDILSVAKFEQVELARTDLTGIASTFAKTKQQVHDPQLAQTNDRLQKINDTLKGLAVAGVAA